MMTERAEEQTVSVLSDEKLQQMVADSDSGGRNPTSRSVAILVAVLAFMWSLFQLWIAQPQLWFGKYLPVLNASQTRPIHLTFAIVLAFLVYPAFKTSPRDRVPILDWIMAIVAGGTAFYIFLFSREISLTARENRKI